MPVRFAGFGEMLRCWAGERPGETALFYEADGERRACSYAGLLAAVEDRAEELRRGGKRCLAVLCDGSFACVVTIFAAIQAGRQVVLLSENTAEERLPGLLAATDADSLWGDEELARELAPHLVGGAAEGGGRLLFFTSGTTESAKAVVLTEGSLMASAYNGGALLPLAAEDVLLCMLPLDHVFGFVCGLLWGLSCGAAVALGRGPRHYAEDCGFFRPTALSAVPLLLGFLLKHGALNPELALLLVGAGDCPPELLQTARELGLRVCFGYGLTETSSGVALSLGDDPAAMTVCPEDEIVIAQDGEILIRAESCMMQGYYKREEDTRRVLENGVLHTGDLGFLDMEGRLHITGRKKEVLVLPDGTKLFLPEYEREIGEALGTTELCVTLQNGAPALVLQGAETERWAVLQRLAPVMERRPRGQQIHRIVFRREVLPRTETGKIKRWEIEL